MCAIQQYPISDTIQEVYTVKSSSPMVCVVLSSLLNLTPRLPIANVL